MLQDIENTEDLTGLVQQMLARMNNRVQVMSDNAVDHV